MDDRTHTWYILIGTFLLALTPLKADDEPYFYPKKDCSAPYKYEGSGNYPQGSVQLACDVDNLFTSWNFSAIQTHGTLGLLIQCRQEKEGTLQPNTLSHLTHLRELRFYGCLLRNLSDGILQGLDDLEVLEVTDGIKSYDSVPPVSKRLAPNLLKDVPKLRKLNLAFCALETIPPNFTCPVPDLILWHLEHNNINDIEAIGCGPGNRCCQNLLSLNLASNSLERVTAKALKPMHRLKWLELSFNRIREIELHSLANLTDLIYVGLHFNELHVLPRGLFATNQKLEQLNLENNHISVLPEDLFHGLKNLITLSLCKNNISALPSSAFKDLHKLAVLDFNYNYIHAIPDHFFLPMISIQSISWVGNEILSIENTGLNDLTSITYLNMSQNKLQGIPTHYFENFTKLTTLDMSENLIPSAPSFDTATHLQLLNLGDNEIKQFEDDFTLAGRKLELHLTNNPLQNLSAQHLKLSSVEILLLNNCSLTTLSGLNVTCPSLKKLTVNHNRIAKLRDHVLYMTELTFLNVSHNALTRELDFSITIPNSLIELDISYNQFTSLYCMWHRNELKLETLHASFNDITSLKSSSFPNSIRNIDLSNNKIAELGINIFTFMKSLLMVNLEYNNLSVLDISWFKFPEPWPETSVLPEIKLRKNPIECDCSNSWLLRKHTFRQYPRMETPTKCSVTQPRMRRFAKILDLAQMTEDQMFCTEKDPFVCPLQCKCYYTFTDIYQVDCGGYQGEWAFERFPEMITHIFLDDVESVPFHSLRSNVSYPRVVALYLNSSHIPYLPENAFDSFPNVRELHLEDNQLVETNLVQLNRLQKLQELHLHNNSLRHFDFSMFLPKTSLRKLTLHSNKLHDLSGISITRTVSEITLADNPFVCSCEYVPVLQSWIRSKDDMQVDDADSTYCLQNNDSSIPLFSFNESPCVRSIINASAPIIERSTRDEAIYLITGCFFFVLVMLVVGYFFRDEIIVYLYARHGIRLFYKNKEVRSEKAYDAFVCYSYRDEDFVVNQLVPGLQRYRLCLHERDFPVGGYIVESVLEAVQQSCRTILVVSPSFVKSQWCRFEFQTAHQQSLNDRCCRLIAIIIEDIPDDDLDNEMRLYLRTNTYLKWDHQNFWDKLRYALPDLNELTTPREAIPPCSNSNTNNTNNDNQSCNGSDTNTTITTVSSEST